MAARLLKSTVSVTKTNPELGIVWGWASVADVIDLQGDVVPQVELEQAVYQFMEDYYAGRAAIKENHRDAADVVLVESVLEWRAGSLCWWVGVKLLSDDLREAARNGEISGFSIGGTADGEADEPQA